MHSFRPPARINVYDLIRQASQLRHDAEIFGTPRPEWRFDVSHGTYEQLLMTQGVDIGELIHGGPSLNVDPQGGETRMTLFGILVAPSTEVPDDSIVLTYGAIAKFEVVL